MSRHISNGAIIGIAVGAAFAGMLFGAGIAAFFMFRKQRRMSRDYQYSKSVAEQSSIVHESKTAIATTTPTIVDYDRLLPQPLDASRIKQEVIKLFDTIENHVQNFYHVNPVDPEVQLGQGFQRNIPRGVSEQSGVDFVSLIKTPKSRLDVVTCLIAAQLVDGIDPLGRSASSLLPSVVTSFFNEITYPDWGSHVQSLCVSRWRTSTAYLLKRNPRNSRLENAQRQSIKSFMQSLDISLAPFVVPDKRDAYLADLEGICERTENFGMELLAQPMIWEFFWSTKDNDNDRSSQNQKEIIVFPGLRALTDDNARKIATPQLAINAQTRSIG